MDQGFVLLDIAKQLKRIANALENRNEMVGEI